VLRGPAARRCISPQFLRPRRAKAVVDYLTAAGIDKGRLRTIYGKERPIVPGHDESAWCFNGRGHFVVK